MRILLLYTFIFGLLCNFANATILTVVTEDNFEPYNYLVDGKVSGMATDIVKATLDKAGVEYDIYVYPWARAYKMAQTKKNVMIYSIGRNDKREKLFKWVGPIVPPIRHGLFKLKSRKNLILNELKDAKKYTIGTLRKSSHHQYLLDHGFEIDTHLQVVSDSNLNIKKLFAKRLDLIVGNTLHIPEYVNNIGQNPDDLEMVFVFNQLQLYMAFGNSTSDQIVLSVNKAFTALKKTGAFKNIIKKY